MADYVDNKRFLEELIKYKESCAVAEAAGEEVPIPNNFIGKSVMDMSKAIATKPNFSGYPFLEEMIFDGIENCLTAIKSFDPTKSTNPFGYFSKVIWWAFLRRIEKEKKQLYIKFKMSRSAVIPTYDGEHTNINLDAQYMDDFIRDYEERMEKKKQNASSNRNG